MSTASSPKVHELAYGQSWSPALAPTFNPGTVRVSRVGDTLELEARLSDSHIRETEAKFNDMAYTKGDVFELFLKAEGDAHYHEIHLTPSNVLLQLRFEVGAKRPFDIDRALVWEPLLTTSTERVEGGWVARYSLPLANVTEQRPIPARWRIGCGRYDYQPGLEKPVISNTAPLTIADFHRHEEWPVYDLA